MRKLFAAIAALSLALGAALLGANVASASVGTMTLDDPTTSYEIGQYDGLTITGTTTNQSSFVTGSMAGDGLDRIYWSCSISAIDSGTAFSCTLGSTTTARPVGAYTLNINEFIDGASDGAQDNSVTVNIAPAELAAPPATGATVQDAYNGTVEITGQGANPDPNARLGVYDTPEGNDAIDPAGEALCQGTIQSSGAWSCTVTGLGSGTYIFFARQWLTQDDAVTAGTISERGETTSVDLERSATPTPTVTFGPGTARIATALADGATSANIDLYSYADGETAPVGTCGQSQAPDCTFPNLAGAYEIIATQYFDDDSSTQELRSIYVPAAPGAPTVTDNGDGTAEISGEWDPGEAVTVYDGSGNIACDTMTSTGSEEWSCTGPYVGATEAAYGISVTDPFVNSDQLPADVTYIAGGRSAIGELASATITDDTANVPSMLYDFQPAGITITGTPTGDASSVHTTFYSWSPSSDDEEESGGFVSLDDCPADDSGVVRCTFTNLAPGYYNPDSNENGGGEGEGFASAFVPAAQSSVGDDYFVVPTTPTISSGTANGDSTATLSGIAGSAVPGDRVYAVADGVTAPVCSAIADDDGSWSCTTSALAAGPTTFRVYQEDLGAGQSDEIESDDSLITYVAGGLSAVGANAAAVTIAPPVAPEEPTTPPAIVQPTTPLPGVVLPTLITPIWSFDLSGIDLGNIHPGDAFTITGTGPAGATIKAELHSTPVDIGSTLVDKSGTFTLSGVIPADIPTGAHHIILTMSGTGLVTTSNDKAITVVAAAVPATASAGGTVITTDPSAGEKSESRSGSHIEQIDPADPTAPNILSRTIDSIQGVISHPGKIVSAIAIGLVLLIFATLPAHLLSATLSEQYDNLARRMPRLKRTPRWLLRVRAWLAGAPLGGAVVLIVITALLFGFADPHFGFTLASLRLILGLIIAMLVTGYLVNAVTGLIMRRRWSVDAVLSIRPLGLILTIIGVLASRLLHFSPGFLIGLVLGLTLVGRRSTENAWKAVLVRTGITVGLGVVAWVGYSALTTGEPAHESFWSELFVESLVAITTEGIVALLIELLPFRLLEGERLYRRSRVLWGAIYVVVIAVFVIAIVPWEGNWATLGSALWVWIAVVAVFAIVCLAVYFYFRFWSPFGESEELEEEEESVEVGGNV